EATVYVVPARDGQGPAAVLAPAALLERLARRPAPPAAPPGAVLVGADYQGTVRGPGDRTARFEAVFHVYCPGEGPATLELPLDGVRLEPEVLLDGARALPTALPPPRPGYALKVAGAGLHKVRLAFLAEVTA